jgi:DNA (cytosine-5)-methyltransferase 1
MIARRDGPPIVWPEPTHFKKPVGKQKKWKPAADCIDFTDLGKSIFDRPKPLAPATMRRIAKGIKRYVLDNPQPFIVNMAHGGKLEPVSEPISTIATEKGGCRMTTITNSGSQQQLVTAFMSSYYTDDSDRCRDATDPMATITTENRIGLVDCILSPEDEAGALRVASFLINYYGNGQALDVADPMDTVTTRDRLALVTVMIQGTPYVIVDIRLRMLKPRELFRGQDFHDSYIIDRGHDGRKFSVSAQVRMCGNSVDPVMATAFLEANAPWLAVRKVA